MFWILCSFPHILRTSASSIRKFSILRAEGDWCWGHTPRVSSNHTEDGGTQSWKESCLFSYFTVFLRTVLLKIKDRLQDLFLKIGNWDIWQSLTCFLCTQAKSWVSPLLQRTSRGNAFPEHLLCDYSTFTDKKTKRLREVNIMFGS